MKITITKSKWNGAAYSIADPYIPSWDIDANQATWKDVEAWCQQSFGPQGDPWNPTADITHRFNSGDPMYTVRIPSDKEAILFQLAWVK